ncbi:hypothetical protein TNCV_3782751 [Trichonephila clavipes]|nr:hypothetical protein TNCV_3782751 [Trichonephila clavipes]
MLSLSSPCSTRWRVVPDISVTTASTRRMENIISEKKKLKMVRKSGGARYAGGAGIEPTDTSVNRITTIFANVVTPRIRNALSDKAAMEEDLMFAILSWLLQLPMRSSVYHHL